LVAANPAASLKRKLREARTRRERGHHAAMPYSRLPDFMAKLTEAQGIGARCLEFLILTASRTSEALNAQWLEFDLAAGIWTIPAERMKARDPHVVHVSSRAVEIVNRQEGQHKRYVFPSMWNDGRPLSNMSLLMTLRRLKVEHATVHGFRASFSSWANECGIAKPDAIEAALAHRESNLVRRAYNRAAFLAERRVLMTAWCDYLAGRPVTRADGSAVVSAQVLDFPKPQAA
jgi:integrase